MPSHLLRILGIGFALLACERNPSPSELHGQESSSVLGLNDVAILLPYNKHPDLLAKAPTISGPQHVFVSPELLKEVGVILGEDRAIHENERFAFGRVGNQTSEADPTVVGSPSGESPYRLVSMRFDPCVNELRKPPESPCEANVRIVFQPLLLKDGEVFAKDSNVHAIYRLDVAGYEAFLSGLTRLRLAAGRAPSDEALDVHPVIAREGADGPYFSGLMSLIQDHLSLENLKRVAFFGDTNIEEQGHWPMLAFDVEDGRVIRVPLDHLGKQDGEIQKNVQRLNGNHEHLDDPMPRGNIEDTLFPVLTLKGDEGPEEQMELIGNFMQVKYANSFRLDDPTLHDPMTADCASCHVAHIQRSQLAPEMQGMGMPIPQGIGFHSERWNLASNVGPDFSRISLQIFSYFRTLPKVAPRAANDAAHSLDIIQGKVKIEGAWLSGK